MILKLFAHKLQLAACLVCVLLTMFLFASTGSATTLTFGSPKVADAALDIDLDSGWVDYEAGQRESRRYWRICQDEIEVIPEHMKLTQIEPVLALAAQGCEQAQSSRAMRMRRYTDHGSTNAASSYVVGYDGDSDGTGESRFMTQVSVVYT